MVVPRCIIIHTQSPLKTMGVSSWVTTWKVESWNCFCTWQVNCIFARGFSFICVFFVSKTKTEIGPHQNTQTKPPELWQWIEAKPTTISKFCMYVALYSGMDPNLTLKKIPKAVELGSVLSGLNPNWKCCKKCLISILCSIHLQKSVIVQRHINIKNKK